MIGGIQAMASAIRIITPVLSSHHGAILLMDITVDTIIIMTLIVTIMVGATMVITTIINITTTTIRIIQDIAR